MAGTLGIEPLQWREQIVAPALSRMSTTAAATIAAGVSAKRWSIKEFLTILLNPPRRHEEQENCGKMN